VTNNSVRINALASAGSGAHHDVPVILIAVIAAMILIAAATVLINRLSR
jgi:hypothetical protein